MCIWQAVSKARVRKSANFISYLCVYKVDITCITVQNEVKWNVLTSGCWKMNFIKQRLIYKISCSHIPDPIPLEYIRFHPAKIYHLCRRNTSDSMSKGYIRFHAAGIDRFQDAGIHSIPSRYNIPKSMSQEHSWFHVEGIYPIPCRWNRPISER